MGKSGKKNKVSPEAAKAESPSSNKKAKVDTSSSNKKKQGGKKGSSGGKTAADSIMEVVAKFHANRKSVDKETVLKMTGIAPKTLSNTLPKLKTKGFIEANGSTISLTDEGVEEMGDMAKAGANNEEVQDRLKQDLTKKQVILFDALLDGKVHSKDELAKDLGYDQGSKTKAFVNLVGALSGKKIVHYPEKGKIQLVEETCFPFGTDE